MKKFLTISVLFMSFNLVSADLEHTVLSEEAYKTHLISMENAKGFSITIKAVEKVDTCNNHRFGGEFYQIVGQPFFGTDSYFGRFGVISTEMACPDERYRNKSFTFTTKLPGASIALHLPAHYEVLAEATY